MNPLILCIILVIFPVTSSFALQGETPMVNGDIVWSHELSPHPYKSVSYSDGKVWQVLPKRDVKKMSWYDAKEYCENLIVNGDGFVVDNFRVPTESELKMYQKELKILKKDEFYRHKFRDWNLT